MKQHPLEKWRQFFNTRKQAGYVKLIDHFETVFGNQSETVIAKAPGRVNLVGMHIDHQGGAVNPIAISETRVIAQPRSDDKIILKNMNPKFEKRSFRISDILPKEPIDWSTWTQEVSTERQEAGTPVDWSDYVKAVILMLQEDQRQLDGSYCQNFSGMNVLIDSDLPVAAGLSSSSSLVVAAAYAIIAINDLSYAPNVLIDMLGRSEWYIGVRGGIGDHAAIILGREGQISHIELLPINVSHAPFPSDYRIVICHCGIEAKKSSSAQNTYNERVAGYKIGLQILKTNYPQIFGPVELFRDLHPSFLGIPTLDLYQMLKTLPIRVSRAQISDLLPHQGHMLETLYQSHYPENKGYRIRGVCLYGIAECERSRKAVKFLQSGDIHRFGELINLSHEGDRVSNNGTERFEHDISNVYLDQCSSLLAKDKNHENTQIYKQPGGYAASCPELDSLVDLARQNPGVHGAGLIGAGLGGCISILVQLDHVDELVDLLEHQYYKPNRMQPFIEICRPVEGASIFEIPKSG